MFACSVLMVAAISDCLDLNSSSVLFSSSVASFAVSVATDAKSLANCNNLTNARSPASVVSCAACCNKFL